MCSHESDWRQRVPTWDEWYYWSMEYGVWASYQQRVVPDLGWMVLSLQEFSQRQVVLHYAVGPYSGCIGGAWVAFNGWNSGEIYRWFMNWYGNLEGI